MTDDLFQIAVSGGTVLTANKRKVLPLETTGLSTAKMTKEQFRKAVCDRMSVFIECGGSNPNFYLDVKSYDSFADMD